MSSELKEEVVEGVDDFPIPRKEAEEIRERLREERKQYVVNQKKAFEEETFSLGEH